MAVIYFYVVLIGLALFITPGDSLSCYNCTSEDSNKDCKSKMKSITCPSGTSQCLTGTLTCTLDDNIEKTIYYKRCNAPNKSGCGSSAQDMPKCPTTQGSWGSFISEDCCTGDNCNSGSSHSINQAMLGIYAWHLLSGL